MNNELFFSIIIPNYNNVKYIEKCIDSVLNQTYKNFEIIIVDDGSTDESIKSLKEKYKNIENIKLIFNNHYGVSKARNTGLSIAQGQWITFLDSDDFFDKNILTEAYNKIVNNDIDFIAFNLNLIDEKNRKIKNDLYDNVCDSKNINVNELIESCVSIKKIGYKKYNYKYGNIRCIGAKFYKRNIIEKNNIQFNEKLITFEDGIFNINYLNYCQNVYISSKKMYNYFVNSFSATKFKKFNLTYKNTINLINYLRESSLITKEMFYNFLDESLNMLINVLIKNKKYEDVKNDFKLIKNIINNNKKVIDYSNIFFKIIYSLILKDKYYLVFIIYKIKYKLKG